MKNLSPMSRIDPVMIADMRLTPQKSNENLDGSRNMTSIQR